jgi:hypothetical protein
MLPVSWKMCAAPGERQYSVASSFGLRSGLRQGGGRFAAVFEGIHSTALRTGSEGVPLRDTDRFPQADFSILTRSVPTELNR